MFAQFKTLPQLFDFFKDQDTCIKYLENARWGATGVLCPHCGSGSVKPTKKGYRCTYLDCQKRFSPLVKTIFENTKLPLRTWFAAMWLISNHKKGVSSLQISRDMGISQKTAWFLLHRIRETFKEKSPEAIGGEGVIVEVDETYIGGKVKNMSNKKKREIQDCMRGRHDNKTTVMGYLERGNIVRYQAVNKGEIITDLVKENIDFGSVLMSDSANTYQKIGHLYAHHGIVDHGKMEYAREGVYFTNSVEGSFSLIDRMVLGIYHQISKKHIQAYLNESAFRYNTRKISQVAKFEKVISNAANRRLTYASLIKSGTTSLKQLSS